LRLDQQAGATRGRERILRIGCDGRRSARLAPRFFRATMAWFFPGPVSRRRNRATSTYEGRSRPMKRVSGIERG
jgi:hypothetical protein